MSGLALSANIRRLRKSRWASSTCWGGRGSFSPGSGAGADSPSPAAAISTNADANAAPRPTMPDMDRPPKPQTSPCPVYRGADRPYSGPAHFTPTHVFTRPGVYTVALELTDGAGAADVGTLTVDVTNPGPTASAGPDQTVAEGSAVAFSGTAADALGSSDLYEVAWDFDYDGQTFDADSSAYNTLTPTHTFTAPGTYEVALQATDPFMVSTLSTAEVTVTDVAPTATVGNSGSTPEGSPVTFTVSNVVDLDPADTVTYLVDWTGSGQFQLLTPDPLTTNGWNNSVSFTHVYDQGGTYNTVVELVDGDGGTTSYTTAVAEPTWHPVAELPPRPVRITEYQRPARTCPCCGEVSHAAIPAEVRASSIGPRLAAVLAFRTGRRLSKRAVEEVAEVVFGGPVALGTVSHLGRQVSDSPAAAHAEAARAVRRAGVKHVDETGWKRAGRLCRPWTTATRTVAPFVVHTGRGAAGLRALLGETITGILCSDRWRVYGRVAVGQRPLCRATSGRIPRTGGESCPTRPRFGNRL